MKFYMKGQTPRISRLIGKLETFQFLARMADGPFETLRLVSGLTLANSIHRFTGRKIDVQVRFRGFHLTWMAASGELMPFREVADVFTSGMLSRYDGAGWVVLDCGANIGLFSLFLRNCEQLIAVEPNPTCHRLLERNFALNSIKGQTINKAVSSHPGWVCMNLRPDSTVLGKVDASGDSQVEATTIDKIISDFSFNRVDLLKLDLEGHEPEALEGSRTALVNGIIRRIYTEFNNLEALEKLDGVLLPYGYSRVAFDGYNALYCLPGCE